MKKQMILIATMVFFALSFNTYASSEDRMIVRIGKSDNAKSIAIQLANLEKKRTTINLIDVNGVGWFHKAVYHQAGYASNINLTGLPMGDYVLIVKRKGHVHAQAVTLESDDISFFEVPVSNENKATGPAVLTSTQMDKSRLISRFIDQGDRKVGVQLSNLQEAPVSIQLVSPGGGNLLTKNFSGQNGYGGTWDMNGMKSDLYFFYVKTKEATVIQFVNVNGDEIEFFEQQRIDQTEGTSVKYTAR